MANLSHEDRELINNRVGAAGARAIQSGSLIFGIATGIISSVYYLSFGLTMVTAAFSSVSIIYLLIYVATVKKYLGKTQRIWAGMLMFALPMLLAMAVIIRTANLFALPFAIITLFAAAFFITDAYLFLVLIALNIISYLIIFWQEPLDYSLRLLAGLVFVWLLSLFVNRIVIASLHRLERLRLQEKRFREQLEREVHEREQAQAALATAYAQVEQQVTERTQALNNSLAREKDLSLQLETSLAKEVQLQQMKTNIINNVSHEFRTPLHIINMSTDLLMEYREQLSAAQSDKYQSNIKEQVFYMTDMIQDILFVNSGYEITLDKRPFRFNDLVQQLQKDLIENLETTPTILFHYDADCDSRLLIDYPHLKRLAANLLSNGMKFSEPDRVITLEFGMDNGRFLLSITDQGIGILPDEQPFIYDLFFRGSNIETRRGLGLGLNIVQTIVAAFGGSITVHSEGLNRGTSFRVALPIDEETAVLPISSAPTRAS